MIRSRIVYIDRVIRGDRYQKEVLDALLDLGLDVSFREMLDGATVDWVGGLHKKAGVAAVVSHLPYLGQDLSAPWAYLRQYDSAFGLLCTIKKLTNGAPVVVYTGAEKEILPQTAYLKYELDDLIYKDKGSSDGGRLCSAIRLAWEREDAVRRPGSLILQEKDDSCFFETYIRWYTYASTNCFSLFKLLKSIEGGVLEIISEKGEVIDSTLNVPEGDIDGFFNLLGKGEDLCDGRVRITVPLRNIVKEALNDLHSFLNVRFSWEY